MRHSISAFLLTSLVFGTTVAFGQSGPATDRPAPPVNPDQTGPATTQAPGSMQSREFNFAEADKNGDKRVSFLEFVDFGSGTAGGNEPVSDQRLQQFRLLDRNKDAYLTESEAKGLQPPAEPAPPVATR